VPTAADCSVSTDPGCDHFKLTVVPPGGGAGFTVRVTLTPVDDWDLAVYDPAGSGEGSSGNPPGIPEIVVLVNPLRPLVLDGATPRPLREGGALTIAAQSFRVALHRRLREGLKRHAYEHPDTDVVLLEPHHADVQLFDVPLMTYTLRHEVIRRGYRTTIRTMLAEYDRHQALFARHGIELVPRAAIEKRARRWTRGAASDAA